MNVELTQHECPDCHILYWISAAHQERLFRSKETYYCPNGHKARYIGKTHEEELDKKNLEIIALKSEISNLNKPKKKPKKK